MKQKVEKYNKYFERIVFWSGVIVIFLVDYFYFSQKMFLVNNGIINVSMVIFWKKYMYITNFLLIVDLILIVWINNKKTLKRQLVKWFLLLFWVTGSYALAGLTVDLFFVGLAMFWAYQKNSGINVGVSPLDLLR